SVLLAKAKLEFERWKECKPVENPPDETGMNDFRHGYHDGCINTYDDMIYLIDQYENPKFTPSMRKMYLYLISSMGNAHNDPKVVLNRWQEEPPKFVNELEFEMDQKEELDVLIKFLKQAKGMIV